MKKVQNSLSLRVILSVCLTIVCIIVTCLALEKNVSAAAIGVVDNGSTIVVTTGAGLVYTVNKSGGDITSCKINGTEVHSSSKGSHINSGMGATVTWATFSSESTVVITCTTSTFTHYYISRYGDNTIYMATYTTSDYAGAELRYIFYGNSDVLTNCPLNSDCRNASGTAESSDVYAYSDGTTRSKYYGNDQAGKLSVRGCTGTDVGVFIAYGSRETSSGGPFFRDIQFQTTEIYNYMNSGHNQTEAFRTGLHGPYAYIFTTGSTPSIPDFSFISDLGLLGYVPASDRGRVVLNGLNGRDSNYQYTIGYANSTAQYWVGYNTTSSSETVCYGMKPGTYTMTVYKGELAVYTESVTVYAGAATTLNTRTITNDPSSTSTIWRIGDWDGTPLEFLNGSNISLMHPSDVRNSSWGPTTFAVGSAASLFPAVQFRGANTPTTITFVLTAAQAAAAHTLKIGITGAYNNGRPCVAINGTYLTSPGISSQPASRSFTIGTYRGNNTTFTWSVPAANLVTGNNTITIGPISGSSDLGAWLSASFAYDCVEFY